MCVCVCVFGGFYGTFWGLIFFPSLFRSAHRVADVLPADYRVAQWAVITFVGVGGVHAGGVHLE